MDTDNAPVKLSYEDQLYFGASIRHFENGIEYYIAREACEYLGYTKWTAFLTVLNRARKVLQDASMHFRPVDKLTPTPNGLVRSVDDYWLSREAFLLIVMNADGYLPMVARGKGYIAESVIRAQEAEVQRQKTKEFIRSHMQANAEQAIEQYMKGTVSHHD